MKRGLRLRSLVSLVVLILLVAVVPVAAASAEATWLDATPPPWNTPGMAVPTAPPFESTGFEMCLASERPPAGPEEAALAAAGWRVQEYWPAQQVGEITVVMALAGYDGMCRPNAFNAFVFFGGSYAGTLSPDLMNSRTDGVISAVPVLLPDGLIAARFIRYASTDPLCCPSRPAVDVTYRVQMSAGQPVVVVEQLTAEPTHPPQLPRAGGLPSMAVAVLGGALALTGLVTRRLRS